MSTDEIYNANQHQTPTRQIAIAVDSSEHSVHAIKWALANVIKKEGDQVVLLHCLPTMEPAVSNAIIYAGSEDLVKAYENQHRHEAHDLLNKLGKPLIDEGVSVRGVVLKGNVKETLVEKIENMSADLLVIGSKGKSAIKKLLIGSVSDYCLHHCHCPVLITRLK